MGGILNISNDPKVNWMENTFTFVGVLECIVPYLQSDFPDLTKKIQNAIVGFPYLDISEMDERQFNHFVEAILATQKHYSSYHELLVVLCFDSRYSGELNYADTAKIVFGKDSIWAGTGWVYQLIFPRLKKMMKDAVLANHENDQLHLTKATKIIEQAEIDLNFDFTKLSLTEQKYFISAFDSICAYYGKAITR